MSERVRECATESEAHCLIPSQRSPTAQLSLAMTISSPTIVRGGGKEEALDEVIEGELVVPYR